MVKTQITPHRKYLVAMFKRRYPGAKLAWVQPLKQVDEYLLVGRIEASGARWNARPMQATVYLPRSWREGPAYQWS